MTETGAEARLELAGLDVADPPERWAALGFTVLDGEVPVATGTPVRLGIAPQGAGIVALVIGGLGRERTVAGLRLRDAGPARPRTAHGIAQPNRARGIDHVVISTPDLDHTATALAAVGLGLSRRAEIRGRRMGFRRLGGPILEVVEDPAASAARFWGVTFTLECPAALDALAATRRVGTPRPAVQPGRRIATVGRDAGLSTRVAFMDPEPARPAAGATERR